MTTFFLICAVIGGTILACQFVMTLVGLGGEVGHLDADGTVGDLGDAGAAAHDVIGAHEIDVPEHADVHLAHAHAESEQGHDSGGHHGSTWLFGILSFRTLTAAITFFGLAGWAAQTAQWSQPSQVVVALASGAAAMFLVHGIMRIFFKLSEDGTIRISRAIGREATVYIPIPAGKSGAGKVQIKLQDRLVEYEAVTPEPQSLATGAKVYVVGVRGANTLEVRSRESVKA